MSNDSAGRDEFEKWAISQGYSLTSAKGRYLFIESEWNAWNAALSRQSAQGAEAVIEKRCCAGRCTGHSAGLDIKPSQELEALLERYWDAAYAEGADGRDTDTEDGKAMRALTEIRQFFRNTVPRAELEQYRKDAERYRWLRDNVWPQDLHTIISLQKNAKWDEAIDRAMQEGK